MWQAIAASVKGESHIKASLPCQDRNGYEITEKYFVAVVSDGLGSERHSDIGSKVVVESALGFIKNVLQEKLPNKTPDWKKILSECALYSRNALQKKSGVEKLDISEYGATLIVVIGTIDWLAIAHLGDGAVVAGFENGDIEIVSNPQQLEFDNDVIPLTAINSLDSIKYIVRKITKKTNLVSKTKINRIAILTDGLQKLALNIQAGEAYTPFFKPFFDAFSQPIDSIEESVQLGKFLSSDKINKRTNDDKTLLIIGSR
jgi:hypothetical protein